MHYLYRIINLLNGKIYIGQTNDGKYRWRQHRYFAKNPERTGQYIHHAMAKHGIENFIYELIATCRTQEDANEVESLLITQYNTRDKGFGYNLTARRAYGGHSEETKAKISAGNKGKQRSEETKSLIAENTKKQMESGNHPRLGKKHSEESRQKMVESSKGQVAWNKGLTGCFSEETKQKMSEAKLGKKASEETKHKMSVARTKNRKCSIEGCENPHDAKGYCSKHYYHLIDKQNRPRSSRKLGSHSTTNKI